MNSVATVRALIALTTLGAGLASANGTEPGPVEPVALPAAMASAPAFAAVPGTPPLSASPQVMMPLPSLPAIAPVAPVWLQIPAPGLQPYYMVPQAGGMAWSLAPAYPAPSVPPARMQAPPGWVPYVLVWVPMQPPASAEVNYGPVAETPVVVLPPPETSVPPAETGVRDPDAAEPAAVVPAPEAGPPVSATAPGNAPSAPATPSVEAAPIPAVAGQAPAPATAPAAATESVVAEPKTAFAPPAVEPKPAPVPPEVDYGPVTPTPVVDLPATASPAAPQAAARPAARRAVKPVAKKQTVAKPAAAPQVKKRMCWSNGVVSPCK